MTEEQKEKSTKEERQDASHYWLVYTHDDDGNKEVRIERLGRVQDEETCVALVIVSILKCKEIDPQYTKDTFYQYISAGLLSDGYICVPRVDVQKEQIRLLGYHMWQLVTGSNSSCMFTTISLDEHTTVYDPYQEYQQYLYGRHFVQNGLY